MTKKISLGALTVFIGLIHSIPFFILVNIAFKSPNDTSSKWITPTYWFIDNFVNAWQSAHLDQALLNTALITVVSVILVVLIGAAAAYPLARFPSRWNTFVYTLCIASMIVPGLTILVSLYKLLVDINGIDTYWAIILVQVTFFLPLTIFLYTGFLRTIPRELDEAALIDGCNSFTVFFHVLLPLLKPVTATVIILAGLAIWNDYQFSVFFLQKPEVQTFPVALAAFFSQYHNNVNWAAAGCLISMLPAVFLFLFLQRYFIRGVTDGVLK
ncbi:putative ABC transporter permease protein AmyC [Ktedonobacter sp. SOSP1-52]|uniref:carbohydrate ABC transporter permease n=1 Tax=Ktedonobacter sp. SOSP1-52 TaxID=2778366 RepID=UPI0019169340|nr:carbohydrate ABC transporter permease [Ktedonobacter sp. SOSP1-52]GHO65237.1 putative ABC transporter permease protein AmyC [Ktedonobacter sp. SOSP1-52]